MSSKRQSKRLNRNLHAPYDKQNVNTWSSDQIRDKLKEWDIYVPSTCSKAMLKSLYAENLSHRSNPRNDKDHVSVHSNTMDNNPTDEADLEEELVGFEDPLDGSLLDVSVNEEVKQTYMYTCKICSGHYSTKSNLRRHLKKHEDPVFECKKCTRYFSTEAELLAHQQVKHTQKEHLCTTCGKTFVKNAHLYTHQRRFHEQNLGENHTCPFDKCSMKFQNKLKFQDHVNKHTGVKPFSCTVCSRDFHSRYYKSRHEKICTGTTLFTCEICGKALSDMSSLNRHKTAQHKGRNYTCGCGKIFRYESSLAKHKKSKEH